MDVPAQAAFDAMAGYLHDLVEATGPAGVHVARGGAELALSGIRVPFANGVWIIDAHADAQAVADLLDQAAASGLPFLFVAREERREEWAVLAERRGLVFAEDTPLMVHSEIGDVEVPTSDLVYRSEVPTDCPQHIGLAADAFDTPVDIYTELMETAGRHRDVRVYLGQRDGVAVTTAVAAMTPGPSVGVFSVATPAAERGRGYGLAITAHALVEGVERGAQWAWLQSSEAGFHVYERLGFRTVGIQPMWAHLGE